MKILGISCGSVMGNSEIMLRKALMSAEAKGAEVEMIRINDFFITPCNECGACEKEGADYIYDCIYEDDFPAVAQEVLESDGLIVSFPVYNWSPDAQVKVLADRFGFHYNRAHLEELAAEGIPVDARLLKQRPVGFISVAGAMDEHYYSMGLGPALQFSYDLGLIPVDQVLCGFTTDKGHCLKHDDKMAHAGRIGEHVADAIETGDFSWKGEAGTCPSCHNNMMILKDGKITCPFCGIEGTVSYDGTVQIDFSNADLLKKRTDPAIILRSYHEMMAKIDDFCNRKDSLAEKMDYYRCLTIPKVEIGAPAAESDTPSFADVPVFSPKDAPAGIPPFPPPGASDMPPGGAPDLPPNGAPPMPPMAVPDDPNRPRHILGISFGIEDGNCDILTKEALLGAKEAGAEIRMARIQDLKILPCVGCHGCMKNMYMKASPDCVLKGDQFNDFIKEVFWADGVVFVTPVTKGSPNSFFRIYQDHMPTWDVAGIRKAGIQTRPDSKIDPRAFDHRTAGLIAVGASAEDKELGFSMMQNITHCLQMDPIDGFFAGGNYGHGQVLEQDAQLKRAREVGRNVAEEAKLARKKRTWHGETGTCPVCHHSVFVVEPEKKYVSCCNCAIDGILVEKDGRLIPQFSDMELRFPRTTEEEMLHHHSDVDEQMFDYSSMKAVLDKKKKVYKDYNVKLVKPPR